MAEKKCKYCAMRIPKDAKVCPRCHKRQGWSLPAKILGALFIMGMIGAGINSIHQYESSHQIAMAPRVEDTNGQKSQSELGNNAEAEGFAKAMNSMSGGKIVWHLDLTPQKIRGRDIVDYRKSVSYCKATISVTRDEWFKISETEQKNFIKSQLDVLHKPPLINVSQVLDYYPNSTGEASILADGKVVATGKYSKKAIEIVLQPGTYKPDEVGKYWAKINIVFETVGVKFEGTTNIPDSKSILFTFSNAKYKAQSNVVVHDGTFSTDTFKYYRSNFPFGKYSLKLNAVNPLLEARGVVVLPDTKSFSVTFAPTKL